jgi:WD40 repeat protein
MKYLALVIFLQLIISNGNSYPQSLKTYDPNNCNVVKDSMKYNNIKYLYWLPGDSVIISDYVPFNAKGGSICTWNVSNGKRSIIAYLGDNMFIKWMDISHNGEFIIIATLDNKSLLLECFAIKSKKWLWEVKGLDHYDKVIFSEDDKEVLAAGYNAVYRIDAQNGNILKKITYISDIYPMNNHRAIWDYFSSDGKYLVIWQEQVGTAIVDLFRSPINKNIGVFDIKEEKLIASFPAEQLHAISASFTKDDSCILFGCEDGIVKTWSIKENKIINEVYVGNPIQIIINKQNSLFAVVLKNKYTHCEAAILEYPSMKLLKSISPFTYSRSLIGYKQFGSFALNFDNSGKYCAMERGGKLFLYDTSNWNIIWCTETDQ